MFVQLAIVCLFCVLGISGMDNQPSDQPAKRVKLSHYVEEAKKGESFDFFELQKKDVREAYASGDTMRGAVGTYRLAMLVCGDIACWKPSHPTARSYVGDYLGNEISPLHNELQKLPLELQKKALDQAFHQMNTSNDLSPVWVLDRYRSLKNDFSDNLGGFREAKQWSKIREAVYKKFNENESKLIQREWEEQNVIFDPRWIEQDKKREQILLEKKKELLEKREYALRIQAFHEFGKTKDIAKIKKQ